MEAFLAVSGYGVVSLGGELEGDEGVREPVAIFEPVGGGGVVAEPDGVQEEMDDPPGASKTGIPGLWTFDLHMQAVAVQGGESGLGAVLASVEGVGEMGVGEPLVLEGDGVDGSEDPGLSGKVEHLLELVGGVKVDGIGAVGVVLVEDGGGEALSWGRF